MPIYKNQARTIAFQSLTTAGAANTSTTPVVQFSIDGGAFANVAGTPAHVGSGCWKVALLAAELNGDLVVIAATAAGCVPSQVTLFPEADYTQAKAAFLDGSIAGVLTAVNGKPNAAQVAAAILVNTANKIATDNTGAVALPATAPAGYGGSGGGGSDPWTTAIPGSYTSGQAGAILGAIKTAVDQVINAIAKAQITGAVNDGGPTQSSFVMGGTAATRATVADCYKLGFLEFTGGSNQGIARKILTVNTSTKVVTFATPFPFPVANTDTFTIQGVSE